MFSLLTASGCGSSAPATAALPVPSTELPVIVSPAIVDTQIPLPTEVSGAATEEVVATEPLAAPMIITHLATPGAAVIARGQEIRDCNTGERIAIGVTTIVGSGCDDWNISKIERPVTNFNENFTPWLDINNAFMGESGGWYYASIYLHKSAAGSLPADLQVALELDIDLDSIGEYLILSTAHSDDWSSDGVQVWQDSDGDVGGYDSQRPDDGSGNGYETLLYDAGQGDDTDLAWARIHPTNTEVVEIAFKDSLVPNNGIFAWWVWTAQGGISAAQMEMVDALEADTSWSMDNTCGWIYGASPSKQLRNLCFFATPTPLPTPTFTPPPGCVQHDDAYCRRTHPSDPPGSWEWNPALCSCTRIN